MLAEESVSVFSAYASISSDTLPGGPAPFYLPTDMLTEARGQLEVWSEFDGARGANPACRR